MNAFLDAFAAVPLMAWTAIILLGLTIGWAALVISGELNELTDDEQAEFDRLRRH